MGQPQIQKGMAHNRSWQCPPGRLRVPAWRAIAFAFGLTAAGAGLPAAALAQAPAAPPTDQARPVPDVLEDAGRRLFEMLELLIKAIPQYEMPEILPNGDIVIRRKPRPTEDQPPLPPGHDRT